MSLKIDEVYPNGSNRTDDRLGPGYSAPIHGGAESGKVAPEWLASMTREEDPNKKKKKDEKRRPNEPAYEAYSAGQIKDPSKGVVKGIFRPYRCENCGHSWVDNENNADACECHACPAGMGVRLVGEASDLLIKKQLLEKDARLEKAGVSGYNKPKRTPKHPTKSHVVVAKVGKKIKTIRFGQQGVSGSPKKEGESDAYRKRRKSFKARHAKNIKKGKMSAAYWADKVKW